MRKPLILSITLLHLEPVVIDSPKVRKAQPPLRSACPNS